MEEALAKILKESGGGEEAKESLKGHAERLWKFLDNLAESDPEEYQNFLKKQAEAAGVGMIPKAGGGPSSGAAAAASAARPAGEHPAIVVLAQEEGGKAKPPATVALRIFDDNGAGGTKEGSRDSDEEVGGDSSGGDAAWLDRADLKLRRRGQPRRERFVEGLPPLQAGHGYLVVDVQASAAILRRVLAPSSAAAVAAQPKLLLDTLVNRVAEWAEIGEGAPGLRLSASRRVLVLKAKVPESVRHREAAQGTSASALPESLLGEIANLGKKTQPSSPGRGVQEMAGKRATSTGASGGAAKGRGGPLIEEVRRCVTSHRVSQSGDPAKGEVKVFAKVDERVPVGDLEVELDKNVLTFSSESGGGGPVRVPLPMLKGGAYTTSAKFKAKDNSLVVKIKPQM
mmetsp:Transcript_9480/g.24250  ORF Transcript_9480/g.24250 Transcript_9480/m.24250 type:complete len:399 (-) Transcript_9480:33-1229(-)